MTPHFFYISDITISSTLSGKSLRKKSMLEIKLATFIISFHKECLQQTCYIASGTDTTIFKKHNSLKEIDEGETMQIFNAYKVFVSKQWPLCVIKTTVCNFVFLFMAGRERESQT